MTDQVVNMFGHFWWPSIISTPDIYPQPRCFSGIAQYSWKRAGSDLYDHHHLTWFSLDVFTLLLVREIFKLGDVAYFGKFYKLGENLLLYLENTSWINLFCDKNFFYGALTCSRMLGIIDRIYFEKKLIYMIFGYGACQPNLEISSLIKRNNYLNGKKINHHLVFWYLF